MKKYPKPTAEEVARMERVVGRLKQLVEETSPERASKLISISEHTLTNLLSLSLLTPRGHWRPQKRTVEALFDWDAAHGARQVTHKQAEEAKLMLLRYIEEGSTAEDRAKRYSSVLEDIARRGRGRK